MSTPVQEENIVQAKFNLLDDPWILYQDHNGDWHEGGLAEVLKKAHEIVEIRAPIFNGKIFAMYEYLLHRLLSVMVADIFRITANRKVGELMSEGKFDEDVLQNYFDKYHDRFYLIHPDHPFMQATDEDMKKWKEKGVKKIQCEKSAFLIVNPTAVAETGRLYGTGLDNAEVLKGSPEQRAENVGKALQEAYKISYAQFAYILLHINCMLPGVGGGNKSGLCGKCFYWEILKGKTLFETVLLNAVHCMTSSIAYGDKPIWRYDSTLDLLDNVRENHKEGHMILSSMFFPPRIIRGYTDETGYVDKLIYQNYKGADSATYSEFLETYVNETFGLSMEPHGGHITVEQYNARNKEYHEMQARKNAERVKKGQEPKKEKDLECSRYFKVEAGEALWLRLAGSLQVEKEKYSVGKLQEIQEEMPGTEEDGEAQESEEDDGKQTSKTKAEIQEQTDDEQSIPSLNTVAAAPFMTDDVKVELFYRICTDKWGYLQTGKVIGVLPLAIKDSIERQKTVTKIVRYFHMAYNFMKWNKTVREAGCPKLFCGRMEYLFGLHDCSGYIRKICKAEDTEEAQTKIYEEIREDMIKQAKKVMRSMLCNGRNLASKMAAMDSVEFKLHQYGKKEEEANGGRKDIEDDSNGKTAGSGTDSGI